MRIAITVPQYDASLFRSGPALGPEYLAASLSSQGHEVDLYDLTLQNTEVSDYLTLIVRRDYGLVGFSCLFTSNLPAALDLAQKVRAVCPEVHLCIGGQATSFVWKDILERSTALNSVCCFEGEETICDLAQCVEKDGVLSAVAGIYFRKGDKIEFSGFREPPTDLDSLQFPSRQPWSAVLGQPHFMALTSRGCAAHCTFCCSGNFGNAYHSASRWRMRSSANILNELDELVSRYNAEAISFVDDDFLGACEAGPPRAREFVTQLKARSYLLKWGIECRVNEVERDLFDEMKSVGLSNVFMGIDSGNLADLKLFGKGATLEQARRSVQILRSLDLSFRIGFIMFHPLTTLQLIKENLEFLSEIGIGGTQVLTNKVELYAGSPLLIYFSRKCDVERKDFNFRYSFNDPLVALYRRILKPTLALYKSLEYELERARFECETGINKSSDEKNDVTNHKALRKLQDDIWISELDIAKSLLDAVQSQTAAIALNDAAGAEEKEILDRYRRRATDEIVRLRNGEKKASAMH